MSSSPRSASKRPRAGATLTARGIAFDVGFTSALNRAQNLGADPRRDAPTGLPESRDQALNERHYGDLQGLEQGRDAQEVRRRAGAHLAAQLRRAAAGRREPERHRRATLPYFAAHPARRDQGETVLVAAHGNSLRSIVMELDGLTPETIPSMELATGVPLVYRLKADSTVASKDLLAA